MITQREILRIKPGTDGGLRLLEPKSSIQVAVIVGLVVSTAVNFILHFGLDVLSDLLGEFAALENLGTATISILATTVILICGTGLMLRLRKPALGAGSFGQYKLKAMIGSGGMGEVWIAEHEMLARPVAVKLIRRDLVGSEGMSAACLLKRFEREARTTAFLHSPHTVAVHDYGIAEKEIFYYVMEFLDGLDFETLVKRFGPVTAERAAHLLTQVCKSLAEAHHFGLIHRDLKPSNIFVCRLGLEYDFVKVLDFGLVKQLRTDNPRLTATGIITGTPAFLAPELALNGSQADARSDIYAFGCIAYWLVTGHLVFESETPIGTIIQHAQASPIPPSRFSESKVPVALERIILSCLEKSPYDRPQSAQELIELIAGCKLAREWDEKTAENWWTTHLPSRSPSTGMI